MTLGRSVEAETRLACRFCQEAFERILSLKAGPPVILFCGFGHRWESSGRTFDTQKNLFVESFSCVNPETWGFPPVRILVDFRGV